MDQILARDNCNLGFETYGYAKNPAIFFCHSLGSSCRLWDRQMKVLSENYFVIGLDLRGHGRSDIGQPPYKIKTLAGDVVALLKHLNVEKCCFVGLSLGSMIGLWLALNHSDHFFKMVLAGASSYITEKDSFDKRIDLINRSGITSIGEELSQRWFTERFVDQNQELVSTILAMVMATNPAGYIGAAIAVRDFDVRLKLTEINLPILLISGMNDPATPLKDCEFIAERVKDSTLVGIPSASHLAIYEEPEIFDSYLYRFIG